LRSLWVLVALGLLFAGGLSLYVYAGIKAAEKKPAHVWVHVGFWILRKLVLSATGMYFLWRSHFSSLWWILLSTYLLFSLGFSLFVARKMQTSLPGRRNAEAPPQPSPRPKS